MKWTHTTSRSNVVIHCRHKNIFFVGVALFTTLSLLIHNYMVATIGIQFSDLYVVNVDQTNTDSTTTYAIFYNAYVNPANVYHSHGIISEQLMQWQLSRYANSTLYYTHLGDSSLPFPCLNNEHCKLLQQKSDGWEEETLSKLQEYCQSNPNHNVIYIHSKGTYTSNAFNDRLRNLITLSALSDECYDGLSTELCNVCSARFSPLPHWHTPGNMWTAKCSYIAKLYSILSFEPKVVEVVDSFRQNCSDCSYWPDWSVGTGRY